jgi:DNA-binding NarL/FixJ family response regulator
MRPNPIRVVIASAERVLFQALAFRIAAEPDLEAVGIFAETREGLQKIDETRPHVALIDMNVPGGGPFNMAIELLKHQDTIRILLLANTAVQIFLEQAARLRLSGYITRDEPIDTVIQAVRDVASGGEFFSAVATMRPKYDSLNGGIRVPAQGGRLSSLTSRQFEVFGQLAKGRSAKEVAGIMHLSQKAVASHKYRLMKKLGIHDRVELARFAIREGVLLP